MSIGHFCGFAGVLLWSPTSGKYLLLKRAAESDFGGGGWECMTGRLEQGESFSEALCRESHEELGIEIQIDFIIGTGHFFRGDKRPENEMIGIQFCASVESPESIKCSSEHSEYRWVTAEEAYSILPDDHWLGRVIKRAEELRALMSPDLIENYRTNGFELSQ
jgi:8-oxo-dGTP diphosphatase